LPWASCPRQAILGSVHGLLHCFCVIFWILQNQAWPSPSWPILPPTPMTLRLSSKRPTDGFSELTGGSEIGVVCFRVMNYTHIRTERGGRKGGKGGDVFSRLVVRLGCLWIIRAFLFVASI